MSEEEIYFEGLITQFKIVRNLDEEDEENDKNETIKELELHSTNFHGFFKGHFYNWSKIPGLIDRGNSTKTLMNFTRGFSMNSTKGIQNCIGNVIEDVIIPSRK